MANTISLNGEARNEFGKGVARRLRVANKIPATIYAGGTEPAYLTLPMRETTLALRHTNALFSLTFDGQTKMAVVKDVQKKRRGAGVRRRSAEGRRRGVRRHPGA